MSRYASHTNVSEERSKQELERVLTRYGATGFGYMWRGNKATVMFEWEGRAVQIAIPLPDKDDDEFTKTPTGKDRVEKQAFEAWEKAKKQVWRIIILMIKAKIEAVLTGAVEFDREFLPYLVLPNGETVGDRMVPEIARAVKEGNLPKMLPGA